MAWSDGIPWAIAVAGWAAVHLSSESRERRKECRAKLDKLTEVIQAIGTDAQAFHSAAAHDPVVAAALDTRIYRLERKFKTVPILALDDILPFLIALRRSVTLENFDSSAFTAQPPGSEILNEIDAAVEDLEDEMERQYAAHYPSTFPNFRVRLRQNGARNRPS